MVSRARLAVGQGLVFGVDVARDRMAEQGQAPVALGLLVEDVLEVTGSSGGDAAISASWKARLRCSHSSAVESWSPSFARREKRWKATATTLASSPRRPPQRLAGSGLRSRAAPGAGDVLEVVDGNRRDAEAALSLGDHQGVGDEQEEGLAQGAGADLVAVLEMFDVKFLAGRVNALDDVPAQALVGPSTGSWARLASGVLCGTASFMIAKMFETRFPILSERDGIVLQVL